MLPSSQLLELPTSHILFHFLSIQIPHHQNQANFFWAPSYFLSIQIPPKSSELLLGTKPSTLRGPVPTSLSLWRTRAEPQGQLYCRGKQRILPLTAFSLMTPTTPTTNTYSTSFKTSGKNYSF